MWRDFQPVSSTHITVAGVTELEATQGTKGYIAPEQFSETELAKYGPLADVFSLGAWAYPAHGFA